MALTTSENSKYENVRLIFTGTIIHSLSLTHLEIIEDGALGVNTEGKISFLESWGPGEEKIKRAELEARVATAGHEVSIRHIPRHSFLIPGFVDTHVHAPQYTFTGTGYSLPLLDWLATYTFPQERKFESTSHASSVYPRSVGKSLRCGTTTAAWYGTIHTPSTLILAETCLALGQRAFVGKVCMDRNGGPGYVEESSQKSMEDTRKFVSAVQKLQCPTVQPILTPRFAVSCSGPLLEDLASLSKEQNLLVQTHCAENKAECEFVQDLFPGSRSYVDAYNQVNLLSNQTLLAHCVHLSAQDRTDLARTGTGISHCPVSNFALESGICDVRALLDCECKVGLGTDVAGGWSMSILEAMRNAIIASKVIETQRKNLKTALSHQPLIEETGTNPLTPVEVFYLATQGGANVLNLGDRIGNFHVGKEFDALIVDLTATVDNIPTAEPFASRTIDIYEHDDTMGLFEKFIFLGDDRNIREVFVGGKSVFRAS
ncbi:hypothetical protein DFS34DRAFT_595941 [Phlyctochytrium arcticum]|nr:hypothetical protein DFS34DRAFT_595941 [Phlyctochytrium arcticum]